MNIATQKLELIQWISNLNDLRVLEEVLEFRKKNASKLTQPKRFFGCGKDIILEIADDFNEPLDEFNEYKP